jgi:CDP-diacylglycerol--glycerol-3-phosphate 3-phosphatidyltransferase
VTAEEKQDKLRLVTILTLVRFPLVLLFFVAAVFEAFYPSTALFLAALIFMIASAATDLFDGYLARKHDVVTDFGAHADPLMDKLFYLVTLPTLVFLSTRSGHAGHASLLLVMTVLFLARDQWVTFLRAIGSMYAVSGCANWTGKIRTGMMFPVICAIYVFEAAPPHLSFINFRLLLVFEILALVLNAYSFFVYTIYYWPHLQRSASLKDEPAG